MDRRDVLRAELQALRQAQAQAQAAPSFTPAPVPPVIPRGVPKFREPGFQWQGQGRYGVPDRNRDRRSAPEQRTRYRGRQVPLSRQLLRR
ncbi:hypothetical protein HGRIS_006504 [Hohenbuehelia grisea]|uniref:Uncharacterized protein n=1 Tax=Hohenbuehelia grisea TaxID=104357 RepID=A0ABR3J977_9AGAR